MRILKDMFYVIKIEGTHYVKIEDEDVSFNCSKLEEADSFRSKESAIDWLMKNTRRVNNGYPFNFTIEEVYSAGSYSDYA